MSSGSRIVIKALLAVVIVASGAALAQDDPPEAGSAPTDGAEPGEPAMAAEPPPPIYEDQLLRLSEILGSLAFLRDLCGDKDGAAWREEMGAILSAEQPGPQRRGRLIGRFNHGFETFNAVYRTCTASARLAVSRYIAEGRKLSNDVRRRYSQ